MSEDDLLILARKFEPNAIKVDFFRKSHNLIYKVYKEQNGLFILRLSSINHRSIEQIISELDFQRYLFDNGAAVVRPLMTQANEMCIQFEIDGSIFYAAAFSYAQGDNWDERCDNSESKYYNIGKELGRIHKISKSYSPTGLLVRRQWDESQHLINADEIFKNYNKELHRIFTEFMTRMHEKQKSRNCFGLTHGDYLLSNYMIDKSDRVTVFDFDECEYSWFAVDVAICMHCYLIGADPSNLANRVKDAELMHYNLLLGYKTENELCEEMIIGLEPYLRIRDFIYLSTVLENQTGINEWGKKFIDTCMDRIMNNKKFLDFDTSKASNLLT